MKKWDWIFATLCGAWLLALWAVAAPDHDSLRAFWSQTTAAWVQAIGSVGAILAAMRIASSEARRHQRQAATETDRQNRIAITTARRAFIDITANTQGARAEISKHRPSLGQLRLHRAIIASGVRQLEALPLGALPGRDFTLPIVNISSGGQAAMATLDELIIFVSERAAVDRAALNHIDNLIQTSGRELTAAATAAGYAEF